MQYLWDRQYIATLFNMQWNFAGIAYVCILAYTTISAAIDTCTHMHTCTHARTHTHKFLKSFAGCFILSMWVLVNDQSWSRPD